MGTHISPSPNPPPSKRARHSPPGKDSPASSSVGVASSPPGELASDATGSAGGHGGAKAGQGICNFRNVSACNRCRARKNRCDQKLPSCASCEKANVACVGYDPITRKEIPRSYVFYLETRAEQLEALLSSHNIPFPAADNLEYCSRPGDEPSTPRLPAEPVPSSRPDTTPGGIAGPRHQNRGDGTSRLDKPGSRSDHSDGGSIAGVSFARVVLAAVQSSVSDQKSHSDKTGVRPYKPGAAGTSMRDSFFGLHTKPTIHPATFPDKALGRKLAALYFEHANPQIPVLHKGEFRDMFEQAYAGQGRVRGPKELYLLNMVFAIGGAIILGDSARPDDQASRPTAGDPSSKQCQPEEYHASAIVHLEACLGNSGGGLAELQTVLLLANFALLRPVPPGLWYIVGVAIRLAVDLGLHYEDGKDPERNLGDSTSQTSENYSRERGRREYTRDLRRRLWWCTYSLDRLVSVCVGRPFGISDQVITTEFPSLLQDRYIMPTGFLSQPPDVVEPTYKLVAHHYFRLRLLQSEILQVLQYQHAQAARTGGLNRQNPHMHTHLPSPFLSAFDSFRSWRIDIDRRLYEWKASAPRKAEIGVAFSLEFFDLNYWQTIIMLYRQSLSVPAPFEGEYHTAKEVNSPAVHNVELREDEDRVYVKIAEAGQKTLRLYRQLHIVGLVNYTYLATHQLFTAGISYLYAIWHSPIVRSRLSMDEVDFTMLAATSVFTDLIEKCPPAEACRDAFGRTAKATIKMVNSVGGFGPLAYPAHGHNRPVSGGWLDHRSDWSSRDETTPATSNFNTHHHSLSAERPPQQAQSRFNMTPDPFVNTASPSSPVRESHRGIPAAPHHVKSEADGGFFLAPAFPGQARSNAGSSGAAPATPDAAGTETPLMGSSPTAARQANAFSLHPGASAGGLPQQQTTPIRGTSTNSATPVAGTPTAAVAPNFFAQPQQQQAGPGTGTATLNDLHGMEFLQGLRDAAPGLGEGDYFGAGGGGGGGDAPQMGLGGFGIGWDGYYHHDFNDGPQFDLGGFFFGDLRGVGMGPGPGAEAGTMTATNGAGDADARDEDEL